METDRLSTKTLLLLQSEHDPGTWIGPALLTIANDFRSFGGSWEQYENIVRLSYLWMSYEGFTADTATERYRNLERAWNKSFRPKPFDLHESLDELRARVRAAPWTGRTGSRDLAVLLAFIDLCQDGNCFTHTVSKYELSKWTAGFTPDTTGRALLSLLDKGTPLHRASRTDIRETARSTRAYTLNLDWRAPRGGPFLSGVHASMSTPGRLIDASVPDSLLTSDVWSSSGLGQTAGRVFEVLNTEDWMTRKDIASVAGMSEDMARRATDRLYDSGLVVRIGQRPVKYRRAEDVDLRMVAQALGCAGAIDQAVEKVIMRQEANADYRRFFTTTNGSRN